MVKKLLMPKTVADVSIAINKNDLDRLVTALLTTELYHPLEPGHDVPGHIDLSYRRMLYEVENKLQRIRLYLNEVNEYTYTDKATITVDDWDTVIQDLFKRVHSVEEELDPIIEELLKAKEKYRSLVAIKNYLEPLRELDLDLGKIRSLEYFYITICLVPLENERLLRKQAKKYKYNFMMHPVDKEKAIVLLISLKEDEKKITQLLKQIECTEIRIPEDLPQNPSKAYEAVVKELEKYEKIIEEKRNVIVMRSSELRTLYSELYTAREALRLLSTVKQTDFLCFTRGFVLNNEIEKFIRKLKEVLGESFVMHIESLKRGAKKISPPSPVKVPKMLKPFQMIVESYGHPTSNEIVPILLVAFTFPIIYAFMFPDAGHALAIMAFGLFLMKKSNGREGWWNTGLLAIYLGIAAFITGFLSGEFFGPLTHLSEIVWDGHAPLTSPLEAAEGGGAIFLGITIALRIGAFMLISGTLMGFINSLLLARDFKEAIAVKFPKFLAFFSATYPFLIWDAGTAGGIINNAVFGGATIPAAKLVRYGFLLGLILLFFLEPLFEARKHGIKAFFSSIGMMFMEVFEIFLMTIGNTASFLRILGLSMAHSGIMFGFSILTLMIADGVLRDGIGLIVYVFGNLLAIGLEGIIVYAHTLRLHYYEWFTKFYSGTGIPYEPLTPLAKIIPKL